MSSIREARQLWEMVTEARHKDLAVVLATLVGVHGSAYRRPGAKMVMRQDGRMRGALSGGCLEGDLFLHAEKVMETGLPVVTHYDLTEDEMWGLGIGCKGQVDIWLELIRPQDPLWQAFGEAVQSDQPVLWGAQLPAGRRFLLSGDNRYGDAPAWADDLWAESTGVDTGFRDGFWYDRMSPPERLVIAGAGHDAEPVAELASRVGFEVFVLDPREHVNNREHFPSAAGHWVVTADQVDPKTVRGAFWVIMNHHQRRDEEALRLAAQSAPRFLGVLGPRARTQDMLEKTGVDAAVLPLRAPVGLDLGAESPEQVAVSIVAELMASQRKTTGGSLNGRERIHAS